MKLPKETKENIKLKKQNDYVLMLEELVLQSLERKKNDFLKSVKDVSSMKENEKAKLGFMLRDISSEIEMFEDRPMSDEFVSQIFAISVQLLKETIKHGFCTEAIEFFKIVKNPKIVGVDNAASDCDKQIVDLIENYAKRIILGKGVENLDDVNSFMVDVCMGEYGETGLDMEDMIKILKKTKVLDRESGVAKGIDSVEVVKLLDMATTDLQERTTVDSHKTPNLKEKTKTK